jgi:hypothetical protein
MHVLTILLQTDLVQAVSVLKILGNFTVSDGMLTVGNATTNTTRYKQHSWGEL